MWPITSSLYAEGFLIVLLGSEGHCSRKALAGVVSKRLFGEGILQHFVAFRFKCNPNYFCFVLHCLRAM